MAADHPARSRGFWLKLDPTWLIALTPRPTRSVFGMRRVAHEVPVQRPARLRERELVVGQGEMVHPDVDVARAGELLDREREQRELRPPRTGAPHASIRRCGLKSCGRCA